VLSDIFDLYMFPENVFLVGDPEGTAERVKTAALKMFIWCWKLGGWIKVPWTVARHALDVTGSPCVDFSSSGQGAGLFGRSWPVLVSWAHIMIVLCTAILVHENVVQQDKEVLQFLLGPYYRLWCFILSPEFTGFSCTSRMRCYTLGAHRERCVQLADPYQVLCHVLGVLGSVTTQIKDVLLADVDEVLEEAAFLGQKRGIVLPDWLIEAQHAGDIDLTFLLNERELDALRLYTLLYMARWGVHPSNDLNCLFYLGDNPETHCTWSCVSGKIPSLRTGGHLMWIPSLRRFVTAKEFCTAYGFPVYPSIAAAMGPGIPVMQMGPHEARHFLGNCMHSSCVGVVMLVGLACFRPAR
jgi:hypothetical protein